MAEKINGAKMEEVAGGVSLVKRRLNSGWCGIELRGEDELKAYNRYLKDTYGNQVFEDEGITWTIDDTIKDNIAEFNGKNGRLFVEDYKARDLYADFKDYCSKNGLGITFN